VTDRIASFDWNLEEAQEHHLELNRQMNAQVDVLRELYGGGPDPGAVTLPA
jgi:hypothetical protein